MLPWLWASSLHAMSDGETWGAFSPSPHPVENRSLGSLALNPLHACDVSS